MGFMFGQHLAVGKSTYLWSTASRTLTMRSCIVVSLALFHSSQVLAGFVFQRNGGTIALLISLCCVRSRSSTW